MRASKPSSAPTAPPTAAGAAAEGADLVVDEILDGLAEGFFALDSSWRFIAFNRAAEEIFDLRREGKVQIFPGGHHRPRRRASRPLTRREPRDRDRRLLLWRPRADIAGGQARVAVLPVRSMFRRGAW
jgi:PAS domain-containing protein